MRALIHDGRFKEAGEIRKKCEGHKINHRDHWFRLALNQRDWDEALKLTRNNPADKIMTAYLVFQALKEKKILTVRGSSMTVHRRSELEDLILL